MAGKTIGKRKLPELGEVRVPSQEEQERLAAINSLPYSAPKGVHFFSSHEKANAAHEQWAVETMRILREQRTWKK